MQQTINVERVHKDRMMDRLQEESHKAFFVAAASKSQGDRSFDSISGELSPSSSRMTTAKKVKRKQSKNNI